MLNFPLYLLWLAHCVGASNILCLCISIMSSYSTTQARCQEAERHKVEKYGMLLNYDINSKHKFSYCTSGYL